MSRHLFAAGKLGPWPAADPDLTPRALESGTGSAATSPCDNGCIGPFTSRPDMDDWLAEMIGEAGYPTTTPLPQYHCDGCGTDNGFTTEQLKGAA